MTAAPPEKKLPPKIHVWHYFAHPARFMRLADAVLPWLWGLAAGLLATGLVLALWGSPPDWRQSETVRIMYVHVPTAWAALGLYASLGVAALISLIWRHALAELYLRAAAPAGAVATAICLGTGAIWGKPIWGVWWVWDARLTSMLILLFLYLGAIALMHGFDRPQRGERAAALLVLAGTINLPVIEFSVEWWQTLHQPASLTSLSRLGDPALPPAMLGPLLVMAAAIFALLGALVLLRLKTEILARRLESRRLRLAARAPAAPPTPSSPRAETGS